MTYQYQCLNIRCNNEFEVKKPITAPISEQCPKCGSDSEVVISGGGGFILKGSGWPGKEIKHGNV